VTFVALREVTYLALREVTYLTLRARRSRHERSPRAR